LLKLNQLPLLPQQKLLQPLKLPQPLLKRKKRPKLVKRKKRPKLVKRKKRPKMVPRKKKPKLLPRKKRPKLRLSLTELHGKPVTTSITTSRSIEKMHQRDTTRILNSLERPKLQQRFKQSEMMTPKIS
jgi:hypothetical protein